MTAEVAVVKVIVGSPMFTAETGAVVSDTFSNSVTAIAGGHWVTDNKPGSNWAAFQYSAGYGRPRNQEARYGERVGPDVWLGINAPANRPSAIGKLQVGFIQILRAEAGTAVAHYRPAWVRVQTIRAVR